MTKLFKDLQVGDRIQFKNFVAKVTGINHEDCKSKSVNDVAFDGGYYVLSYQKEHNGARNTTRHWKSNDKLEVI